MITLSERPAGPVWLDLPQGVRLHVRPYEQVVLDASRIRAMQSAQRLVADQDTARELGSSPEVSYDLKDKAVLSAVTQSLTIMAFAESSVMAWEGVTNPLTPDTLRALLRRPGMADVFLAKYADAYAVVDEAAEGNV